MSHSVSASTARVLKIICPIPALAHLVNARPGAILARQGTPRRPRPPDPHYRLEKAPIVARAAYIAGFARQGIFNAIPLILS
ncbi:MAG TPA: hypothetical protein PKZ24_06135 [Nitrospirales bacterium]|nr:hypothetical protein [Nitrospirales bacterium]